MTDKEYDMLDSLQHEIERLARQSKLAHGDINVALCLVQDLRREADVSRAEQIRQSNASDADVGSEKKCDGNAKKQRWKKDSMLFEMHRLVQDLRREVDVDSAQEDHGDAKKQRWEKVSMLFEMRRKIDRIRAEVLSRTGYTVTDAEAVFFQKLQSSLSSGGYNVLLDWIVNWRMTKNNTFSPPEHVESALTALLSTVNSHLFSSQELFCFFSNFVILRIRDQEAITTLPLYNAF